MFAISNLKRNVSIGLLTGSSIAFSPPPSSSQWDDSVLPDFRNTTTMVADGGELQTSFPEPEKISPIPNSKTISSASVQASAHKQEEPDWKTVSLAILTCLITLPGYALALRRGTPLEKREHNPIYRMMETIAPDGMFFPNNRATWIASTANSSALFGLGMLQALSQGQSFGSALASLAVIGVYGAGAGALAYNSLRHGRGFEMSATDKVCLTGSILGVATLLWSGLTRAGILPPVDMPLEMFGIVTALSVRTLALTPLVREFVVCARTPDPKNLQQGFPNLLPHALWTAPVLLNLLNPQVLASKAAIIPVVVSIQGAILLGVGIWARRKFMQHARREQDGSASTN